MIVSRYGDLRINYLEMGNGALKLRPIDTDSQLSTGRAQFGKDAVHTMWENKRQHGLAHHVGVAVDINTVAHVLSVQALMHRCVWR